MATIRCPNCGYSENLNLHGRYLLECDQCGQKFMAAIISSKQLPTVQIVCPNCGRSEEMTIAEDVHLRVTCSECGYVFEKGSDPE